MVRPVFGAKHIFVCIFVCVELSTTERRCTENGHFNDCLAHRLTNRPMQLHAIAQRMRIPQVCGTSVCVCVCVCVQCGAPLEPAAHTHSNLPNEHLLLTLQIASCRRQHKPCAEDNISSIVHHSDTLYAVP